MPEMKEAAVLFKEMQKNREHMAVLIDEYGGFPGIVTIEDLVEEVVGDINEEYDEVKQDVVALKDGEYILRGDLTIEEVNEKFELELESEDYDTISGFLIEKLGYIPNEEHSGTVEEAGYQFRVAKIDGNAIVKVSMKKISVPVPSGEA